MLILHSFIYAHKKYKESESEGILLLEQGIVPHSLSVLTGKQSPSELKSKKPVL